MSHLKIGSFAACWQSTYEGYVPSEAYLHSFNVWEWYDTEFVIDNVQSREPRLLRTQHRKLHVRLESCFLPRSARLHVTADTWAI